MHILIDHLMSVMIGGSVLLILLTTQIYSQRASLEATTSYATSTKALSFGEWLEDDMLSLGTNFGRNPFRFETPTTDSLGNTTNFQFYSDSLQASGDTLRYMTRYRLEHVDTVMRGGNMVYLYQVNRQTANTPIVNGVAAPTQEEDWLSDGRSMATLSGFNISMLDGEGEVTPNVAQGDYIRVEFSIIPQFPIEPEYLREVYWSNTLKIRPFWEIPNPG